MRPQSAVWRHNTRGPPGRAPRCKANTRAGAKPAAPAWMRRQSAVLQRLAPRHLRATRSHQLRVTAANRCTSSPCARAPARRRRRRGRTILKISKKKMFKKSNKKFVLRIIRRRARIIFKTLSKLVQKIKQKISPRRPWISAHPHERIFAEVAARVQGRDGVLLAGGHQVHLPFRVGGRESLCPYLFTYVSVSFHGPASSSPAGTRSTPPRERASEGP